MQVVSGFKAGMVIPRFRILMAEGIDLLAKVFKARWLDKIFLFQSVDPRFDFGPGGWVCGFATSALAPGKGTTAAA